MKIAYIMGGFPRAQPFLGNNVMSSDDSENMHPCDLAIVFAKYGL